MADYEPPSFSLGLDLGLDLEPQLAPHEHSTYAPAQDSSTHANACTTQDNDEGLGLQVMDSDPDTLPESNRTLKRLRRGPSAKTTAVRKRESPRSFGDCDDEIEEFSSQEDFLKDANPTTQYQSMCSSSKIPLHGCGVLTTQSSSQLKARKRKQFSDAPASASLETGCNESMFPKLTISPLRRFQLLDSDSDDPSGSEDVIRDSHQIGPSSMQRQSNPGHSATLSEQKRKVATSMNQNEDLWKDLCPVKSLHVPTPALDEVCEEYFQSLKEKNVAPTLMRNVCVSNNMGCHKNTTSSRNDEQIWESGGPLPPAHHYFFHDDPRIRQLVRNRLHNFSPLGVVNNRGSQQPNASLIDYMRQFNNEEASKGQATRKNDVEKSSARGRSQWKKSNAEEVLHASGSWVDPKNICPSSNGEASKQKATRKNGLAKGRKKSKKSNAEEVLDAPGSWVDPKSCASIPKDAGKRRIHANGQSAGHWYTGQDGRKVYVNKGGQELTGRNAYRHYKKESGAGFRKSKKKSSAKKRKG